jgi:hypothetical protein
MRWVFVTFLICLGLGNCPASARTVFDYYGDKGAMGVSDECPAGSYFVGVVGATGEWIDQITVVCGTIQPDGSIKGSKTIASRGGGGGTFKSVLCGTNEAVTGFQAFRTKNYEIAAVTIWCTNLQTFVSHSLDFSGDHYQYFGPEQNCKTGELGAGLVIRYGKYVNGLGLICGDYHPVATAVNPPPVTTPPVITPPALKIVTVVQDVEVYSKPGHKDADDTGVTLFKGTPEVQLEESQPPDFHVKWPAGAHPAGEGWVYSAPAPDFTSLQF